MSSDSRDTFEDLFECLSCLISLDARVSSSSVSFATFQWKETYYECLSWLVSVDVRVSSSSVSFAIILMKRELLRVSLLLRFNGSSCALLECLFCHVSVKRDLLRVSPLNRFSGRSSVLHECLSCLISMERDLRASALSFGKNIETCCLRWGMGWLRSVGSIKLYVSFAESRLFYRSLLQKRPMIVSSALSFGKNLEICSLRWGRLYISIWFVESLRFHLIRIK